MPIPLLLWPLLLLLLLWLFLGRTVCQPGVRQRTTWHGNGLRVLQMLTVGAGADACAGPLLCCCIIIATAPVRVRCRQQRRSRGCDGGPCAVRCVVGSCARPDLLYIIVDCGGTKSNHSNGMKRANRKVIPLKKMGTPLKTWVGQLVRPTSQFPHAAAITLTRTQPKTSFVCELPHRAQCVPRKDRSQCVRWESRFVSFLVAVCHVPHRGVPRIVVVLYSRSGGQPPSADSTVAQHAGGGQHSTPPGGTCSSQPHAAAQPPRWRQVIHQGLQEQPPAWHSQSLQPASRAH